MAEMPSPTRHRGRIVVALLALLLIAALVTWLVRSREHTEQSRFATSPERAIDAFAAAYNVDYDGISALACADRRSDVLAQSGAARHHIEGLHRVGRTQITREIFGGDEHVTAEARLSGRDNGSDVPVPVLVARHGLNRWCISGLAVSVPGVN